mgnify:CR=1 FL=1
MGRTATKTGAGRFPQRVAAIDVGSSGIRFVAARFSSPERWETLLSLRVPVRLGHGVFLEGRLAPRLIDAAVRALASFRAEADKLGIRQLRAVATSAVRESENGDLLVDRARREAGVTVEVISGSEEARLVHAAVRRRVPLGRRSWLLADLGGGSVEISLADAEGIRWSESHTMGTVRLVEELCETDGQSPAAFERLLQQYVGTLHLPPAERLGRPAGLIATGGNIEALAKLAGLSVGLHGATLPVESLRRMTRVLSRLSYRERISDLGLREDRADVILPAAVIYERVAALIGARTIRVPFVGLKDGVLHDLVDRIASGTTHEDYRQRLVHDGALVLGRRYAFDERHGRHVMQLALSLFDQLSALHGLGSRERGLLLAAGLLHDIGSYVSYKRHHRHSMYLLSHAELPGLTPHDMELVAAVARYHRKSGPRPAHPEFARLGPSDRRRVVRLAAILRLADALDREHRQRVHGIRARVAGKEVVVSLEGRGSLVLERWALRRKARLFEQALGVRVRLREEGGAK